ncbi:MAG: hypothetical protein L0H19_05265, partial [Salinisphaera sp.]|nr:hypothetical protein [Salinisphaera sp.]
MPTAIEDEATRHCRDRIHTIAAYYWAEAQACYPQALANQPLPPLKFNLTGSCAGQVQFIKQRARVQPLCIRFNLDIARHNADSCHETTVAHEVAHAVAVAVG